MILHINKNNMNKLKQIINTLLTRKISNAIIKILDRKDNFIVSVTNVIICNDFKQAHVYISTINTNNNLKENIIQKLNKNKIQIQSIISQYTRLKYTPVIIFINDDEKIKKTDKLLTIMNQL